MTGFDDATAGGNSAGGDPWDKPESTSGVAGVAEALLASYPNDKRWQDMARLYKSSSRPPGRCIGAGWLGWEVRRERTGDDETGQLLSRAHELPHRQTQPSGSLSPSPRRQVSGFALYGEIEFDIQITRHVQG